MTEIPQQPPKRFECLGLSVHFMYSFALAKKRSESEFEPVDAFELVKPKRQGLEAGTPPQRRGIKQHLDLREEIAFKNLKPFRAEVVSNMEGSGTSRTEPLCRVEIEPLLRVFRTGATCCYKVSLRNAGTESIALDIIHAILGLVQQVEGRVTPSLLRLSGRPSPVTLHSLFTKCVREFTAKGKADKDQIVWLDESMDYITGLKADEKDESQSPWVITAAEVQGETADAFCSTWAKQQHPAEEKAFRLRQFEAEVAGILFRSVNASNFELEPAYGDSRIRGAATALHNLNLDARLHVTMCNRSILCIYPRFSPKPPEEKARPEDYFLPDLLDLCEILRARWHMLTIMNLGLDKVLSDLKNEKRTAEQKMRMVINARGWLARLLEDPELYRIAGDALADISLRLKHVFREDELRSRLLEKAQLIERIREGMGELSWLSMEERFRDKFQR